MPIAAFTVKKISPGGTTDDFRRLYSPQPGLKSQKSAKERRAVFSEEEQPCRHWERACHHQEHRRALDHPAHRHRARRQAGVHQARLPDEAHVRRQALVRALLQVQAPARALQLPARAVLQQPQAREEELHIPDPSSRDGPRHPGGQRNQRKQKLPPRRWQPRGADVKI